MQYDNAIGESTIVLTIAEKNILLLTFAQGSLSRCTFSPQQIDPVVKTVKRFFFSYTLLYYSMHSHYCALLMQPISTCVLMCVCVCFLIPYIEPVHQDVGFITDPVAFLFSAITRACLVELSVWSNHKENGNYCVYHWSSRAVQPLTLSVLLYTECMHYVMEWRCRHVRMHIF